MLLSRAERLSGPAQRLLRTAAVAGRWVPERLLAEVAAVSPAELYEALREAVDASLLVVDGSGPRLRVPARADPRRGLRGPAARRAGRSCTPPTPRRSTAIPGCAGDDAAVAATLAVHWYAAHDLPRALAASVQAGRQAMAAFAPAEARRHLERALEVWRSVPDAETLGRRRPGGGAPARRARAAFHGGDPERALPLLTAGARSWSTPTRDPERAALIIEQRAETLRALGEDGAGMAELEEALARLPEEPPALARAAVLASLANTLMRLGDARGPEVGRSALAAARAVGAGGRRRPAR